MTRFACLAVILCLGAAAQAVVVEQFPSDNATWTLSTITDFGTVVDLPADWLAVGGNPDGHLTADVGSGSARPYAFGLNLTTNPQFGDMNGLVLTVDFKTTGTITGPTAGSLVRFYVGTYLQGGSNFFVTHDAFSWNPNNDAQWATHQVQMLASNFVTWPNQNAGTRTFEQVVAAPDAIGLVFAGNIAGFTSNLSLGFSSADGAELAMDNFGVVVPEAASAVLLVLCLAGGRTRRRTARSPSPGMP
jgi:hypothetical protein